MPRKSVITLMITRYVKKMPRALNTAESACARTAWSATKGTIMAMRATRRNRGDPGGCGTCIIFAAAMNSPTSQKTTVGESVAI